MTRKDLIQEMVRACFNGSCEIPKRKKTYEKLNWEDTKRILTFRYRYLDCYVEKNLFEKECIQCRDFDVLFRIAEDGNGVVTKINEDLFALSSKAVESFEEFFNELLDDGLAGAFEILRELNS